MSQRPDPPSTPSDPSEAIAAYLAGDLDEAAVAELEERLATDSALAGRADALREALVALGGVDDVEPPDGYAARLRARLDAEAQVTDLAQVRRARMRRWSAAITGAAAAVVLGAAGLQVLGGTAQDGPTGGDVAMRAEGEQEAALTEDGAADMALDSADDAVPEPMRAAAPEAQNSRPGATAGGGGATGAGGSDADAGADTAAGPVVADDGAAFSHDDELLAHFQRRPEAERWRGAPLDEAGDVAAEHAARIREAAPFADGVRPDACLDRVIGGERHRIVARVERVQWQGRPALAYLSVTASAGADRLDRTELWVGDADGCTVHRDLDLG